MAQLAYFLRRNSLSPVYWLEIVPRSDFQIVYTVLLITTTVGGYKKGFPYSALSVGPGADPGVQVISPQVTVSHPPGGRLPLFSARPAVTSPAAEHHRPLAGTKLYCLVTEAHRCKGCYAALPRVGFEPATYWSQSPTLYLLHYRVTSLQHNIRLAKGRVCTENKLNLFSHFERTPACDGRQTSGHSTYHAMHMHHTVNLSYHGRLQKADTDRANGTLINVKATQQQWKGVFDYRMQIRIQSESGFRFTWQIEWL